MSGAKKTRKLWLSGEVLILPAAKEEIATKAQRALQLDGKGWFCSESIRSHKSTTSILLLFLPARQDGCREGKTPLLGYFDLATASLQQWADHKMKPLLWRQVICEVEENHPRVGVWRLRGWIHCGQSKISWSEDSCMGKLKILWKDQRVETVLLATAAWLCKLFGRK